MPLGKKKLKKIDIEIYGNEFSLRVEEKEEEKVREVALSVTERMRDLSEDHPTNTIHLAIMTAFQLAYELGEVEGKKFTSNETIKNVTKSLDDIVEKVKKAEKIKI